MAVQKSKQELAINRLCNRLSSLRKTLRKDERDLLDQIVYSATVNLASEAEVTAHSALTTAASAAKAVSFTVSKGVVTAVMK